MTPEQLREIKNKDIVSYMMSCGYAKQTKRGKWQLFYSPLRADKKASFGVNTVLNTWADFGTEYGGDIISLVMVMEKLNFNKACEFILEGGKVQFIPHNAVEEKNSLKVKEVTVNIPSLFNYMCCVRRISKQVYEQHCKTVAVDFGYSEYPIPIYAVGFQNDKGGWEVRNSEYKISSQPKWFTTIGEDTQRVNLFEGFINYLSALTYFGKLSGRTYVLNGAGQVPHILGELQGKHVMYYGDNDETGNKLLKKIQDVAVVSDCRDLYCWHDDFNEFIMSL